MDSILVWLRLFLRSNRLEISLHMKAMAQRDRLLLDRLFRYSGKIRMDLFQIELARGKLPLGNLRFGLHRAFTRLTRNLQHLAVTAGESRLLAEGISGSGNTGFQTALFIADRFW